MNGSCLCGSLQFKLNEEIKVAYYCHCRDCQILSGSAFRVIGIVPASSINISTGNISEFRHQSESGFEMIRQNCDTCATPLFVKSARFPDIQMFMVSALENPNIVSPSFEIWCSSKVSWSNISNEIVGFSKGSED